MATTNRPLHSKINLLTKAKNLAVIYAVELSKLREMAGDFTDGANGRFNQQAILVKSIKRDLVRVENELYEEVQ